MAYVYNKVNWEDLPSTNTPRNATNLGNMDTGIKENNNMLNGTKPMGSIVVDNVSCKNLFNKNSWYKSYINPTSGAITTSNNAALFDYIEVEPSTNYTISLSTTVNEYRVSYYTSSKTWISISGSKTTGETFTTPSNCKYVRIYINVDGNGIDQTKINNLNYQFELGTTVTTYTPYKNFDNTGYVLYQDAGNGDNGTITLSDSLDNYSYYEIFYQRSTSSAIAGYTSAKFNKTGNISFTNSYIGSTNAYYHSSVYSASGDTLTPSYYFSIQWVKSTGNQTIITDTNYTYITKVIGYK